MQGVSNILNSQQRTAWLLLAGSALVLELCALFFQYYAGYEPCIKCIYQRLALWGVVFGALPALVFVKHAFVRWLSALSGLFFAAWGFKLSSDHLAIQNAPNPLFASCELVPNFPDWFKPDVWLPSLFEARGDCAAIEWLFMGMSMPRWMQVIFALYCAAIVFAVLYNLIKHKRF